MSKDGVGGVVSHGQGSLWRVDALRGMAADGSHTVDSVASPDMIGHDCGFRAEVRVEAAHTSLEFFKLQWRSAYVCEDGEKLAVCVEQLNTLAWRVEQVCANVCMCVRGSLNSNIDCKSAEQGRHTKEW